MRVGSAVLGPLPSGARYLPLRCWAASCIGLKLSVCVIFTGAAVLLTKSVGPKKWENWCYSAARARSLTPCESLTNTACFCVPCLLDAKAVYRSTG